MKNISRALILLLLWVSVANAECFLNCVFTPGTTCINGECVSKTPTITPSPTPVPSPKITSVTVQASEIWVPSTIVNCGNADLTNFKVFLKADKPPGGVSFYSAMYADGEYFYARKDVLNRFVFIHRIPTETPWAQFRGEDFKWDVWEDLAFKEILSTLPCSELKKYVFVLGISQKGDLSDYKRASFTFQ